MLKERFLKEIDSLERDRERESDLKKLKHAIIFVCFKKKIKEREQSKEKKE